MGVRRSRRPIGTSTPQPLAIVAGLPSPVHNAAVQALEAAFPEWKVIATPFAKGIGRTYADRGSIFSLLRTVCTFASAEADKRPPRPGRFVLFYVRDEGFEYCLDAFGFSTLAVPLEAPDWHWPNGKHWRTDVDVVTRLLTTGILSTQAPALSELKLRLERATADEALLLPPRNFMVSKDDNLYPRFERLHRINELHNYDFTDLECRHFAFEELSRFFRATKAPHGTYRVDRRGLVFATSPHGQHGPARLQDISSVQALGEFRLLLEGVFRFGTPLRDGFQHDVQWPGDKYLSKVEFVDVEAPVTCSGTHANVYANDTVRANDISK